MGSENGICLSEFCAGNDLTVLDRIRGIGTADPLAGRQDLNRL